MDVGDGSIGILVVGAGSFGSARAAAASAARGTSLIAVVDLDRGRARKVASRYSAFSPTNLEAGLALDGVDAVIVATPHAEHVPAVELALARGKHVLCEKPLAIDPGDAWRLVRMAEEAGLRLATGFNHRFYPPVRDALAIVESGGIGRLESVRVQIGHAASPEFLGGWHGDREVSGGGTLSDNGPHACDLIRRFLGDVDTAFGLLRHDPEGPPGCEREAFALFRGREGTVAELHSSWNLRDGYLTVEARGSSGWLRVGTAPSRLIGRLENDARIHRHYLADRLAGRAHRVVKGCERSLVLELEAFAAAIAGATIVSADGWDGYRAVEMVRAVEESDRLGSEVLLRPSRDESGPSWTRAAASRA